MTDSKRVLVLGSGFAGLWAALGAARRLDELDAADTVDVTVISKQPFHDIRVRNYEADLSACRIPLSDVLDPVDVGHVAAEVTAIDTAARSVTLSGHGAQHTQRYDRLVLALGSRVAKPDIPGLREFGFDVDTYDGATKLQRHLAALSDGRADVGAATVVVVGAGLTGIETASELPGMLAKVCAGRNVEPRVVLIDHNPYVGSDMGASARPVIEAALSDNGVETMTGVGVAAVDEHGVTLSSGEVLAAGTVVWCAGMRANPLTAQLGPDRDRLGRLPVDDYLRVVGSPGVFAAGDVAAARVDDGHLSVMSCQHGRPMGRYAGYNVIGDLLGEPMLPLRIPWYATILDLGPAGAVYTEGWDRQVVSRGAQAKATKVTINTRRIYPPLNRDRDALLAAAAPALQARPDPGQ
ncbi:NADH dehydrogenase [Rhodococcus wratislaviensis]|uniref:NADH dehydrogenase n=1 Tax=Rhodococcus wratislaviensis TaxID=44752 RepID=A0AB38FP49_RHOWR|nr:FAD-dependent oxidoreductase [Rhodococcus wratislaviensis]REE71346.1 NADH dehydrogenase [Rhodococcus wratislaviensis]SPZ43326.1 NADH dehydrogenase [Rhodococcus wratislaviensis]